MVGPVCATKETLAAAAAAAVGNSKLAGCQTTTTNFPSSKATPPNNDRQSLNSNVISFLTKIEESLNEVIVENGRRKQQKQPSTVYNKPTRNEESYPK